MISGIMFLLIVFLFEPDCLFKKIFTIPCTTCGMTRAIKYMFSGDIMNALKMNLLSIPFFIGFIMFIVIYLLYIFFKKDYVYKYFAWFVKHYKFLITIFIINWIINIVKDLYY